MTNSTNNILGGILGTAIGDALGVPVEFMSRAAIQQNPVTEMREYGTHNQPRGTWSDDSSMMLCLLEGLVDEKDWSGIAALFRDWMFKGHWTPHGKVFDIGNTTREALFQSAHAEDPTQCGGTSDRSNGNGSLMRTWPIALAYIKKPYGEMANAACNASAITHAHSRSMVACVIYCDLIQELIKGTPLTTSWNLVRQRSMKYISNTFQKETREYKDILNRTANDWKKIPLSKIQSSGYVLHTLEASLWAVFNTEDFASACLIAVNMGDDTDTTGAVTGGLAGTLYGIDVIPQDWKTTLVRYNDILQLAQNAATKFTE